MSAERQRQYRNRKRGGPPRPLASCGTYAAYRRHLRRGEPIDSACREAYNEHQRTMARNRAT